MKRKHFSISLIKTALIFGIALSMLITVSCKKDKKSTPSTTVKYHGIIYNIIKIGDQTWMVENLRTTKYRDGTLINSTDAPITDANAWQAAGMGKKGAWCKHPQATDEVYGLLYNWYAVNNHKTEVDKAGQNLAPTGWRVPNNTDWNKLRDYLKASAGNQLKEKGLDHWSAGNTGANSSGFTALGGGRREPFDGKFDYFKDRGYWWSSTSYNFDDSSHAWSVYLEANSVDFKQLLGNDKSQGFSVRCIRGAEEPAAN